jgi:Kef-type K+ transport system membrane component KefB
MFCNFGIKEYLDEKLSVLGYLFFSPIFFASIGIKTNLRDISSDMLVFAVLLLIVAILTKIVGCGLGAKLCKFNARDSLTIGIGMVSRGEVALIVAQKGAKAGLIDESLFPAIVFVVIVTTLITPILLKLVIKTDDGESKTKIREIKI